MNLAAKEADESDTIILMADFIKYFFAIMAELVDAPA